MNGAIDSVTHREGGRERDQEHERRCPMGDTRGMSVGQLGRGGALYANLTGFLPGLPRSQPPSSQLLRAPRLLIAFTPVQPSADVRRICVHAPTDE
jgi:hypothetical protein